MGSRDIRCVILFLFESTLNIYMLSCSVHHRHTPTHANTQPIFSNILMKRLRLKLSWYNHKNDDNVCKVKPMCQDDNVETTKTKSLVQPSYFAKLYAGSIGKFRFGAHEVSTVVDRLPNPTVLRHPVGLDSELRCMRHHVNNCTKCEFVEISNDPRTAFKTIGDRYKHAHYFSNLQRGLVDTYPITWFIFGYVKYHTS